MFLRWWKCRESASLSAPWKPRPPRSASNVGLVAAWLTTFPWSPALKVTPCPVSASANKPDKPPAPLIHSSSFRTSVNAWISRFPYFSDNSSEMLIIYYCNINYISKFAFISISSTCKPCYTISKQLSHQYLLCIYSTPSNYSGVKIALSLSHSMTHPPLHLKLILLTLVHKQQKLLEASSN